MNHRMGYIDTGRPTVCDNATGELFERRKQRPCRLMIRFSHMQGRGELAFHLCKDLFNLGKTLALDKDGYRTKDLIGQLRICKKIATTDSEYLRRGAV